MGKRREDSKSRNGKRNTRNFDTVRKNKDNRDAREKKYNKQYDNNNNSNNNFNNNYNRTNEFNTDRNFDDQVEGRNSVLELLESARDINKIFVTKGERHGSINKIIAIAKEKRVIIVEKDKKQMDEMAQTQNYQGVIAIVPPFEYCELEDIIDVAKERGEDPFVIILDGIEDPHNLGSIIRTAETAGVHGIVIPKRRSCAVNSTVNKVSAGAVEHMKIARVTNISDAIEKLKGEGLWICGTDINTDKYYYNQDLTGPIGIVIGNEGNGISDKVKKNCDFLVKIPMKGKVTSLNAAVSTGIVIYEAVEQRIK